MNPDTESPIRVEVKPASDVTHDERDTIEQVESRLDWGAPADVQWGHPQWHVLVWQGETLVGHAGLVRRTITVGAQQLETVGLTSVWSLETERGRGHARRAVQEAATYACNVLGGHTMLLLCRVHVAGLYEKLGWARVAGTVTFAQSSGPYRWPALAMSRSCTGSPWPAGDIDLCGLPW